jgi:tetratricopeptide (TPR) repeat protein
MSETVRAVNILYSYAPEDAELRDKLEKHLATMKRGNLIVEWHNRDIQAGAEWEQEIDKHFKAAQIILLLISSDFIASDSRYNIELTRAMERHDSGDCRVIPISLRSVYIKDAPFSKLSMLPKNGRPINTWHDEDEAFANVAESIREVVERFLSPTKEQLLEDGLAHHKDGRYENALKTFERAIRLDPNYARAYRSKGDVLYDRERYEEALLTYEQAIRLDPNHARIHRNRGDILLHLKRYDKALAAYDQAIQLEPRAAQNYYGKGEVLYSTKRYEEALAAYNVATQLDPGFASAYTNKGMAFARLNRFREAISACDEAIRFDPNCATPYNNKGRALYHLGRYLESLAVFEEAIRLDPNFSGAYNNMADTLERLGRMEEAKAARAQAQKAGK